MFSKFCTGGHVMTLIYPFEEEQGKPKFDARKIFPVPIEYQETPAVITVFQLERRGEPGSKIIGVLNSHDLEPHVIWETSWGDFASLVAAVPYDDAPGCIVIYSKTEISLGIPPVTTYYAENIHPADPFTGGADFLNRTWPGRPEPSL
jgi:hypothetical protein